jgi:Tfp pilus assembly protein PilF
MYYPFCVFDDYSYVALNPNVISGLSSDSVRWAFTSFKETVWHPLTWLSLMLDAQLFGSNPMGFHSVNVVLHIANTVLLFCLFHYITGTRWRSFFVAALFALQPLNVESVVWITERKGVLSTLFWMLTILCYAAYVRRSRRSMYLLSLAAFALGLMAKPMLVTLPIVLLLLDYWPFGRFASVPAEEFEKGSEHTATTKQILVEKMPFLALAAAALLLNLSAKGNGVSSFSHSERIFSALWTPLVYIRKMFLPFDLALPYPVHPVVFWQACCGIIILCGVSYLVVWKSREYPYLTVGWFWYLITLVPVSGLVKIGIQSMADRYTYIPLIGLFVMASWGGADLAVRYPRMRTYLVAAGGVILACCSVATSIQVRYWKDNITLFSHALDVTEANWGAHNSLGVAYAREGKAAAAVSEYNEALKIRPNDPSIHHNLGNTLDKRLGRTAEAVTHYEITVRLRPGFALGHYDLAVALLKTGKTKEAITEFFKALDLEPNDAYCHNSLGMAFLQQRSYDEATRHFTEALRLKPSFGQAASNLQFAIAQISRHK